MNLTKPAPLLLLTLAGLAISSCENSETDPELIIPNQAEMDLRKPAIPVNDAGDYSQYPQVRERGPAMEPVLTEHSSRPDLPDGGKSTHRLPAEVEAILEGSEQAGFYRDAIASAMEEGGPAIFESLRGILAENGVGSGEIESLAPELIGAILKGDARDISPEAIEQISGILSEHAPGLIDGVLDKANDGQDSTFGAIAGFVLEKILEKK